MSNFKVFMLMAGMTALLITVGNAVGGSAGLMVMALISAVMNLVTFFFSDKIVLKMVRANPVSESQAPELYSMVRRLSERANIPMPRLYVVNDPSPNAFATGRSPKHGVVAVNDGLLNILNESEIEGVIAHEIAHIKHRDTLTSAIVASLAGMISAIANMAMFANFFSGGDEDRPNPIVLLVVSLIAPIAAMMIQFAVSRAREFEADKTGAELCGRPDGLRNALLKLDRGAQMIPNHTMPQSAAHMCIVNPLSGQQFAKLFSTHPPIEERVRRLDMMR